MRGILRRWQRNMVLGFCSHPCWQPQTLLSGAWDSWLHAPTVAHGHKPVDQYVGDINVCICTR